MGEMGQKSKGSGYTGQMPPRMLTFDRLEEMGRIGVE